jgi:hypothetical protein
MWFQKRDFELKEKFKNIKLKENLKIGQPFAPIDKKINNRSINFLNYNHIIQNTNNELDILFFQGYSPETEKIISVLNSGQVGIVATWFWDNHHLFIETTRNSFLADINFVSHYYSSHYLHGNLHNWGGFIPLAPISWSENEVINYREKYFSLCRDERLYGGYNAYDKWPEREKWLNSVMESDIPNNIKIYRHGSNIHPYYNLSREEKFKEWSSAKVCLCTSFDKNTTIRMFDALLTGGVVLLTGEIADLTMIFPEDLLSLGIVHLKNPTIKELKNGYDQAIELFNSTGVDGMLSRSNYIFNNHMPINRIQSMVDIILSR